MKSSFWISLLVACGLLAKSLDAEQPKNPSIENFDKRESTAPAAVDASRAARRDSDLERLKASIGGLKADFNKVTQAPRLIQNNDGMLTGPVAGWSKTKAAASSAQEILSSFIDQYPGVFGHSSAALNTAKIASDSGGVGRIRTIIWQQELDGISIEGASIKANFSPNGELMNVLGGMIDNADAAAGLPAADRAGLRSAPPISVQEAIVKAAETLGDRVTPAEIRPLGAVDPASPVKKFTAPTLTDVHASMKWLPMGEASLRLCWDLTIMSKSRGQMFRFLVDLQSGEVFSRISLTNDLAARYNVYSQGSPTPLSPGYSTPNSAQPAQVLRLQILDPNTGQRQWLPDGGTTTTGNNVDAYTDVNKDNIADTGSRPSIGANNTFNPSIDLSLEPSTYPDAAVVNLFYWCNWMHDRLLELGFDEASGNFQTNNFSLGGAGNDAVLAEAQDWREPVLYPDGFYHIGRNNANFSTPADGQPPRMQMYLFQESSGVPERDGDLDATIILHEYTHGLSNRLIGNASGLTQTQDNGMGEGWSDFYALALLSNPADPAGSSYPVGAYAMHGLFARNSLPTENYYYGFRRYPYSTDMSLRNPLTFRDIDPAQASSHAGINRNPISGGTADEVHNIGEVWCSMLWDVRAALLAADAANGNNRALRLVTDAMKSTPISPNFIDARDAIFATDRATNAGANIPRLRLAFARRGLGIDATAPASSTTAGLVENFNIAFANGVAAAGIAGDTVAISGRGLDGIVSATIGGQSVTVTATSSSLSLTIPNITPGTYPIVLNTVTPFATTTSPTTISAGTVQINPPPAPTITGFSPSLAKPGDVVSITGTNFQYAISARFDTTTGTNFSVVSTTQINMTVPAGLGSGNYPLTVVSPGSSATSASTIQIFRPPHITQISPSPIAPGVTATITGTDFQDVDTLTMDGAPLSWVTKTSTQITFVMPGGTALGTKTITVSAFGVASSRSLEVIAPPTITSVSPGNGYPDIPGNSIYWQGDMGPFPEGTILGIPGTSVLITGTNVGRASSITFGGVVARGIASDPSNVGVWVPAGVPYGPTSIVVTVGGVSVTAPTQFEVTRFAWGNFRYPAYSRAGMALRIDGVNCPTVTAVMLGGISATTTVLSDSTIAAEIPASLAGQTVSVSILVAGQPVAAQNIDGGTTLQVGPAPAIVSAPTSGTITNTIAVKLDADILSIQDGGYYTSYCPYPVYYVAFKMPDNTEVPTLDFSFPTGTVLLPPPDPSVMTVRIPDLAKIGANSVKIYFEGTSFTLERSLTVNAVTSTTLAPVISSFSPASGPRGTVVYIWGSQLDRVTSAKIGTISMTAVARSEGLVIATVPSTGVTGKIKVLTPAGKSATTTTNFTVTP